MPSAGIDAVQMPPSQPTSIKDHWNCWPVEKGFDPETEVRHPIELSVKGSIPGYASGTLYRTGPGKSKVETESGGSFQISHWFDGFSQTHRFEIIASNDPEVATRVWYNSRFSTDAMIEQARKTGSLSSLGFGKQHDPCKVIFNKMQSEFEPDRRDPSSVNCGVTLSVNLPGLCPTTATSKRWNSEGTRTLHAKTDANMFKELDPSTLEPIGLATQRNFHPDLKGIMTGAHARSDPITGDVFNYNLTLGKTSTYRLFRVSGTTGETTILATFSAVPAYIHSFLMTSDYVILCVWNSHIDPSKFAFGSFLESLIPMDTSQPATWYVVDRKHNQGVVATYETPAFYCFHTINAWQEPADDGSSGIDIVADLIRLDTSDFLAATLYENLKSSSAKAKMFAANREDSKRSAVARFRLPAVRTTPISERRKGTAEWLFCKALSPELPTINPKFVTRKYRYVYSATLRGEATVSDGIMKFDCESKEVLLWTDHGHTPSEAIFVPNPDGEEEDDGVLLSVVLDGKRDESYLLCLNARDLTELGRAEVKMPVGFSFHGQHIPSNGIPSGDY